MSTTTMAEAMQVLHQCENKIVGGYNALDAVIPALIQLHRQAWVHAGLTPDEANARAQVIRKEEQGIRAAIIEIEKRFHNIRLANKDVSAAVRDADAQRKHAARSYQV